MPAERTALQPPGRLTEADSIQADASPLAGFLRALFMSGEPVVGPFAEPVKTPSPDAAEILRTWETREREELAGEAPAHLPAASGWAAAMLYHACQFLVDREADEATVRRVLAEPCPAPRGPAVEYSVDLVFRFLPDLLRLAEQRAPADALTEILRGWAREWPLSSVGVVIEPATPPGAFWAEASLRRLYLDRVFARGAKDRMGDPAVRGLVEADAGPHREFSAGLAAALPVSNVAPIRAAPLSLSP